MKYFAYGSNLDIQQMNERGVLFFSRIPAKIEKFELRFNKMAAADGKVGFANIVPGEGVVYGALYDILDEDIAKLDRMEGVPRHYIRIGERVILEDGREELAQVYIAAPDRQRDGLLPTTGYLNRILAGRDVLPKEYCRQLQIVSTYDEGIHFRSKEG